MDKLLKDDVIIHIFYPLSYKMFTTSHDDELVDFRGLGKTEKAFVPLQEKVCSQHSSLIDNLACLFNMH